jgi:Tol biopolymer transport system component
MRVSILLVVVSLLLLVILPDFSFPVIAGIQVLSEEVYSDKGSEWGFSSSPDGSQFTYVDRVLLRSRDVICQLYLVEAKTGSKRYVYSAWDIDSGSFTWLGRDDFYFAVRDTADLVSRIEHYKDGVVLTVVEGCRFYSLSPDGKKIVYRANYTYSERNARIYTANIDGSDPRLLTRGHDPNWLKGDLIALTRAEYDSVNNHWEGMVELYDLEGHRVRILGSGLVPQASPNRRYLAFDAHSKGSYSHDLVVVDVQDPEFEVRTLVKGRPSLLLGDFSWAPTSDALVFRTDSLYDISEGYISYTNLWAADLNGNLAELTPGVRGVFDHGPVWTESGILFRREGGGESPRQLRLRIVRK